MLVLVTALGIEMRHKPGANCTSRMSSVHTEQLSSENLVVHKTNKFHKSLEGFIEFAESCYIHSYCLLQGLRSINIML
jgi:hypothetical protein